MYACVPHMFLMPVEARRPSILWTWSYRWLWAPHGFWEPNPHPLEKQPVLLTNELSLQPCFKNFNEFVHLTFQRVRKIIILLLQMRTTETQRSSLSDAMEYGKGHTFCQTWPLSEWLLCAKAFRHTLCVCVKYLYIVVYTLWRQLLKEKYMLPILLSSFNWRYL